MNKKKHILLLVILVISFSGCEKVLLAPNPKATPQTVFNEVWSQVDEGYVYFDYKNIDWQGVKRQYESFIYEGMSEDSLFGVLNSMLYELKDGHVNLNAGFNRSRNWDWYQDYPANYNASFVEQTYLGKEFNITGPFIHKILKDNIGYIRYASFNNGFSKQTLDYVINAVAGTKGLILDVRDNSGGDAANITALLQRFIPSKADIGFELRKNGPDHDDFSSPELLSVTPVSPGYLKPVILLTNRRCYSACNIFAGYMSQLDQVTLIGDNTGGGGGPPIYRDLSNGWVVRFTGAKEQLLNHLELEGGVEPDIHVSTGPQEELMGIDSLIERAIIHLK